MSLVSRVGLPTATALAVGLSSSGYFIFANLGMITYGILPGIETVKVEPGKALSLWAFLYETAAVSVILHQRHPASSIGVMASARRGSSCPHCARH